MPIRNGLFQSKLIMQKTMNKKKLKLAAIRTVALSFPLKVIGQSLPMQYLYWTPNIQDVYWVEPIESKINIIIKMVQRALVGITFIVWIINLIKIRKIDDKIQKKKRINRTIIILVILVVILVAAFLIPALLLK